MAKDKIVFTFGRFNPPTTGHEKLIEKVAAVAKKEAADFMVFPSHSQNPKKDPLDFKTKVRFMKKMFPKYSRNIISNNKAKTAINVATILYEMGYKECAMVVGGDRVTEFKTLLNKYNGVEGRHGLYDFKGGIKIYSAGERDPDAEGVTGMSASKMRAAAAADDYDSFKNGLPSKFERTDGKKLYTAIRKAMKVENTEFGLWLGDAELFSEFMNSGFIDTIGESSNDEVFDMIYEKVSQKQVGDLEKFADKLLAKFNIDVTFTKHFADRMNDSRNSPDIKIAELQKLFKKIQKNKGKNILSNPDIEAVLKDISTDLNLPVVINYNNGEFELVTKTIMRKKNFSTSSKVMKYEENEMKDFSSFISERKTAQDPDVKDKEGTQPKKYYAKDADGDDMSKGTKEKRAAHFKKQADKPDGDDKSYKPAPGDANAKTKPSKHTKKYKDMFGEQIDGLRKKADKSGMPYSILKKVYDRGMAAWKSGHRPGTTPQQWAFARVNSFVTKSSGTWGGADKDLAAKVKKESVEEDRDYKKERENYHGTPEQMEKNRARKRARYAMEKAGKAKRGDGKDVHHKDNNPLNNDPKNLSLVTQHYNRKEPRMREELSLDKIDEITSKRRMQLINKIKKSGVVKKGSMSKDTKDKKENNGPCWPGYKQVGMKMKNGKEVPNCVPEETVHESLSGAENPPKLPKAGGGEFGTKTLRDTYLKDTPFMELVMTPNELKNYRNIIDIINIEKTKGN
jgi:hypothetical protein